MSKCQCGKPLREGERECNACVMKKYGHVPTAQVWRTSVGEVLAIQVAKALRRAESCNEPHEFRYDDDGNLIEESSHDGE